MMSMRRCTCIKYDVSDFSGREQKAPHYFELALVRDTSEPYMFRFVNLDTDTILTPKFSTPARALDWLDTTGWEWEAESK